MSERESIERGEMNFFDMGQCLGQAKVKLIERTAAAVAVAFAFCKFLLHF